MAIVSVVALSFIVLMFRVYSCYFDRVMAASLGMNVILLDYMLTTRTAMLWLGVQVVGVIQVVGLLIAPSNGLFALRPTPKYALGLIRVRRDDFDRLFSFRKI